MFVMNKLTLIFLSFCYWFHSQAAILWLAPSLIAILKLCGSPTLLEVEKWSLDQFVAKFSSRGKQLPPDAEGQGLS